MALFKIFNNIDSHGNLPSTYTKGYMYFDAVKGIFYIDTAGEGGTTGTRMAVNAWGAQKAYADENDDRISTTYLKAADFETTLANIQIARTIDGLTFDYTKNISRYGTCSTAAATAAKTVSISDITSLTEGLVIYVKFTYANSASSPTLNLNNLGAKAIMQYGSTAAGGTASTNGWQAGQVVPLIYDGTAWQFVKGYNTNSTYTLTEVWCNTAAGTAAKTSSNASYYVLRNGNYFEITMRYSNTAANALTLNINSTGVKPIYINGEPSSSSNYTLPAGKYIVYYDGTAYQFRTDGALPGSMASANKLNHTLTFGAGGAYVYDGSADVTVPVYTGGVA